MASAPPPTGGVGPWGPTDSARAAFWDLPCGMLQKLAQKLGLAVPPASTLHDTLMFLVMDILTLDADAAGEVVAQRLRYVRQPVLDEVEDILMTCDEAAQCLAPPDEKLVRKEQKEIKARGTEMSAFEVDFARAIRERRAAAPKGKAMGKEKPKPRFEKTKLAMADQQEAKRFMPPGGYL